MTANQGKSAWWVENEELRAYLDLPDYTPPRFADGTYTHDLIPELEEKYDCDIRFLGVDTRYLEDWEVRVDDRHLFEIGHRRDEQGNTVYEIGSEEFRERIREVFEG